MKKIVVSTMLLSVSVLLAEQKKTELHFICCTDFKDFVGKNIPQENQKKYLQYYQELDKRLQEADEKKKKDTFTQLHAKALRVMEIEHPDWHKAITKIFGNPLMTLRPDKNYEKARQATSLFLTRWGSYHMLMGTKIEKKTQPKKSGGVWRSLCSSFAGWFRPKETVTT